MPGKSAKSTGSARSHKSAAKAAAPKPTAKVASKPIRSAKSAATTDGRATPRSDWEDRRPPRAVNHRTDDGNAFMPDPEGGPAQIGDDLAENLAEEYLQAATQGNDAYEEDMDQVVPEEIGGPFVETSAAEEFAHDTDEANPLEAEAEPLPRPVAGLISIPNDEEEEEEEEPGLGQHAGSEAPASR